MMTGNMAPEEPEYTEDYVTLLESIRDEGFLSPGGLGGNDIHIAQNHDIQRITELDSEADLLARKPL